MLAFRMLRELKIQRYATLALSPGVGIPPLNAANT
jgi:hypothetical protein